MIFFCLRYIIYSAKRVFPIFRSVIFHFVIPAWMPESRARDGDYSWHPYPI